MGRLSTLGRAALTILLTATLGPGPAPVLGQSAAGDAEVEQLVRDFYGAVDERRYEDAYAYLSRAAREQQSLADFARPLEPVLSIGVRRVDGISVEATAASLVAHVATTNKGEPPGTGTCARVAWQLVLEDGQWKRESAVPTAEDCEGG